MDFSVSLVDASPSPDIRSAAPTEQGGDAASVTAGSTRRELFSKRGFALGLAVLSLIYVVAYAWLLATSNFVPYVTDNNESFSALVHASNMFNFGVEHSFGLTDEAYGPDPAAHPYVYTHGGNFSRVYAYVLYALGARSVQAQILIATFTVGAAGLFFVYAYFTKLAGARFATITGLVFLSDYLFFAQWQVNSYRVWHTFLLFGTLLGLHGIGGRRRAAYLALIGVLELCLVYFDLTFAVFVSVMAALYAAVLYRRRLRLLTGIWAVQASGAFASVALLVGQTIAYTGWPAFLLDITQTYGARNAPLADSLAGDQLLNSLHDFYASHHIVFWRQLGSTAAMRDPLYFARALFEWTLQPLTPFFSLVVLLLCAGWMLGLLRPWLAESRPAHDSQSPSSRSRRLAVRSLVYLVAIGLAFGAAALSVTWDTTVLGMSSESGQPASAPATVLVALVAAGVASVSVTRYATGRWLGLAGLSGPRVAVAIGLLGGACLFIRNQGLLYSADFQPLALLGAWVPTWLAQFLVLVALGFATALTLRDTSSSLGAAVARYLACGLAAYVIAYALVPGYIVSDYLERLAPLPVYVRDVAIGVALSLTTAALSRAVHQAWSSRGALLLRSSQAALAALVGGYLLFLGGYWFNLQRQYLDLLPPTHYAFLDVLSRAPFQGASFASNTYAAPLAATTGQWALLDRALLGGEVTLTDHGYVVAQDNFYLWFADATTNQSYQKPQYYLCILPQNLYTAVGALLNPGQAIDGEGCLQRDLVSGAISQKQDFPRNRLVAADESGRDAWAIVQLDWDYPPYLEPLPGAPLDVRVEAGIESNDSGFIVRPRYVSRQQDGLPQQPAHLRLYAAGSDGCLLRETDDASGFVLDASFSGLVRVSVTPRTATAVGREYFTEPFWVGLKTFTLPNTESGGSQQVQATSLEEAEQLAERAGTWNPGAGTLGLGFGPTHGSLCTGR